MARTYTAARSTGGNFSTGRGSRGTAEHLAATCLLEVDRPAQRLQRGQLLAGGLTPGGLEELREIEVAPVGRRELRRDRDVGERGVARARVELAQVHHLEQRVEHAAAPLG